MEQKRRSNAVVLTLIGLPIGAATLANVIPEGQQVQRNIYADRAACERDYSAQQCEPHGSSGSSSRTGSWHGPYYAVARSTAAAGDPRPGRGGVHSAVETSTRGGFGAFGRAARAAG